MGTPDPDAPDPAEGLAALTLGELRERRAGLQSVETGLSFVRRLAQGRLDIVAYEIAARRDGTDGEDVVEALTHTLADRITSPGMGHLPASVDPGEIDPALLASLDAIADPGALSDPRAMSDEQLRTAAGALEAFERDISGRRRVMFDQIDALQAEVVRRYQTGEASVENLLAGQ